MGRISTGVTALVNRLVAHAAEDMLLEGFRVFPAPTERALGYDDLPAVVCQDLRYDEAPTNPRAAVSGKVSVLVMVYVNRTVGLAGLLNAVERVLDAIETGADGVVDLTVGNSTINGLKAATPDSQVTGVGLHMAVSVELETVPCVRGHRHA